VTPAGGRLGLFLLLAPALLWLVSLVVLPQVDLFLLSLRPRGEGAAPPTLANYARFFEEPVYWRTFARTAVYSLVATALTLLVAFPVAFYIAKVARGRARDALFLLCLVPFWVSELVRTYGWMILLRESGVVSRLLVATGLAARPVELLYNDAAIMVGLVYSSILFMVVPLVTVLDTLDDSLVEAAYDLGGRAPSVLRDVVVPHAMPGIAAGSIVVFMLTLGNYLTPTLLGGKESLWFTEQVYNQFIVRFNWEQGSAFGFLLLALSSAIVWLGLRLTGQTLAGAVGRR
jgi:spermidine/putrescine transport system permease protein